MIGNSRPSLATLAAMALISFVVPVGARAADTCLVPVMIAQLPFASVADFSTGTDAASDPIHGCTGSPDHNTLWYSYAAPFTGSIIVTTLPGPMPPPVVLSAYSGGCQALAELSCAANASGLASMELDVVSNRIYYLQIAASSASSGSIPLNVSRGPYCGDGAINQPEEECDDGNAVDGDLCTNSCLDATCGDGIIYRLEESCDDGNTEDEDGCTSDCETICGDGIIAGSEDCDDGNTVDGDGCDSDCLSCPTSLCKCLGAAGAFAAVAGDAITAKTGKLSAFGEAEYIESTLTGSLCAGSAKFTAKQVPNDVEGDVILTASSDTAAKFGSFRVDGLSEPGTYIGGDLATGGGAVNGSDKVVVTGTTSTNGTHPGVAQCQQATNALRTASTTLKNLTPTQTLGDLIVGEGNVLELAVGPGKQVINVNSIKVSSGREAGASIPSELAIVFGEDTESVVINVAQELKVDVDSAITVDGVEDAIILNLHGARPKVTLKAGALVMPTLLVPGKSLKLPVYGLLSNVYTAGRITSSGTAIEDILLCQ